MPAAHTHLQEEDPMKKLALTVDDLRVESFGTDTAPGALRGTVAANEDTVRCTANCTCTCGGANPDVLVNAAITCLCCV